MITGSSCSAAYNDAIKKRETEFNSNYTKYCNCDDKKGYNWTVYSNGDVDCGLYGAQEFKYSISYNNECGKTLSATVSWSGTPRNTGYPSSGSFNVTIPTGSGTINDTYHTGRNFECGTLRASGSGSGYC